METDTKATSSKENRTVKAFIPGRTPKSTKVNGLTASNKDKVFGRASLEIAILVSGTSQRQQGMVCINGKMAIDLKESG